VILASPGCSPGAVGTSGETRSDNQAGSPMTVILSSTMNACTGAAGPAEVRST
jgi:hypothetical protein